MIEAVLPIVAALVVTAMALALWRLVRGPALADRIIALDTLYIDTLALLVVLGIHFGTAVFFEVALLIALLGFAGTVVLARYVERGDIIE